MDGLALGLSADSFDLLSQLEKKEIRDIEKKIYVSFLKELCILIFIIYNRTSNIVSFGACAVWTISKRKWINMTAHGVLEAFLRQNNRYCKK